MENAALDTTPPMPAAAPDAGLLGHLQALAASNAGVVLLSAAERASLDDLALAVHCEDPSAGGYQVALENMHKAITPSLVRSTVAYLAALEAQSVSVMLTNSALSHKMAAYDTQAAALAAAEARATKLAHALRSFAGHEPVNAEAYGEALDVAAAVLAAPIELAPHPGFEDAAPLPDLPLPVPAAAPAAAVPVGAGPIASLTRPSDAPPMTPEIGAALTELVQLAHKHITHPDGIAQ